MKSRQLVFSAIVMLLVGCSRTCDAGEPTTANKPPLPGHQSVVPRRWDRYTTPGSEGWGPKDPSGLQLGAWSDPNSPVVRCIIRNQGDKSVLYSDYLLGNWENVAIKARPNPDADWQVIPRLQKERAYYSAGAFPRSVHLLWPGEAMLPRTEARAKKNDEPKAPSQSFSVELKDFAWPREWTGTIDVVVCQSLGRDGSEGTWEGTLESAPIQLSAKELSIESNAVESSPREVETRKAEPSVGADSR